MNLEVGTEFVELITSLISLFIEEFCAQAKFPALIVADKWREETIRQNGELRLTTDYQLSIDADVRCYCFC